MEENESKIPEEKATAPEETEPATLDESVKTREEETTQITEESEEEAEKREQKELEATTDGKEFAARYQSAKERDLEKLSKEMEDRSQNNTKKKKWKTAVKIILMILLLGLSVGIMFGLGDYLGGDQLSFVEMLKTSFSWQYFLVFLAAIAAYIFFESLKYAYLLKISTGKWRLKNSIKTMFLGKYYDGITPLGTGGQPFQIYYLHKRKIPAGVATAVPLVKYIVTTFVFGIMCAVFLGIAPSHFQGDTTVSNALSISAMVIAWVSLFFSLIVPTVMILLSAFPKVGKKIIVWIVKVLHKMHIVKHKYPVTKKYVYEVAEYRNALKLLIKKWYMLIPLILITIVESFIYISLPFFAVTAIAGQFVSPTVELLIQIWCLASVSFFAASMVPTPGNSGASELASSFVFATIMTNELVKSVSGWVIFSWRFSTFYMYILVGICMTVFTMIRSAVRAKRARKNQNENEIK
ncbi:MAG: flippase-like domain-containing protein [Clostridia bacterium]|nr:flippase-like domain-containing protein [Clostridia bacterium]